MSAVVSAVRGLLLLPVPGRAELVLGLTKPVRGRPADDMGRTAGEVPPCEGAAEEQRSRRNAYYYLFPRVLAHVICAVFVSCLLA